MRTLLLSSLLLLAACDDKEAHDTAEPGHADDTGATGDDTGPGDTGSVDDTGDTDEPAPEPDVAEFGFDDTRLLEVLGDVGDGLEIPRDLAFHPERDELWVVNRYGLSGQLDGGSATIFANPGTADQVSQTRADAHSYHFMDEVSSIAFGAATYASSSELTFGTCQESRNDYGGYYAPDDFMGPTLWPSDLNLFANIYQNHPDYGGSHLDMLHQSPLCVGIAWQEENAYWVFDGMAGNIVYYDFAVDHGPGGHDHSDGVVRRYVEAQVSYVRDVPGHMELDHDTGWLYVADTGGARVIRLDTATGAKARNLQPNGEPLDEYSQYEGVTVETFIDAGLSEPAGLALHDGRLFIGDHGTGEIVAFDLETGAELGRMDTGAVGLMGIAFDAGGQLWYVDAAAQEVVRVDPGL